jgi:hypothetical protein
MKLMISIGIIIGATIGGGIGNWFDHKGFWSVNFGGWSILMSTIGSFAGIWAGFKAGKNLF